MSVFLWDEYSFRQVAQAGPSEQPGASSLNLSVQMDFQDRPATPIERRKRSRVTVRWQIYLSRPPESPAIPSRTENLSSEGFYCLSRQHFAPGERLDFELVMPAQEFGYAGSRLRLRGQAMVVRAEPTGTEAGFGLACRIEDYVLLVNMDQPSPSRPM